MIICGVKLTHDGGVALIDDGRLVFSVEMEKLANNPRHQRIDDLEIVKWLLAEYGYRLADVDRFVVDGWRKTHKVKPWGGQETLIDLAPYRRGLVDDNLLRPYVSRMLDLEYTSYPHYAGHVASAYCSSPFARAAEPSYVLCWDGAMFPFLYHYDPSTQVMESLGAVHHMLGDTYHTLAMACPPSTPHSSGRTRSRCRARSWRTSPTAPRTRELSSPCKSSCGKRNGRSSGRTSRTTTG